MNDFNSLESSSAESSVGPATAESSYAKRMSHAYTDDYLRVMGIEHYHLGYFDPDIAPDDLPTALERYLEVLVEPLKLGPDSKVLDLGCHAGATTSWLVRRYGCTVYAIDIVEEIVRVAKERFEDEGISRRAIASCMDAQNLSFESEMFDAVVGIEVFNHFPDKLRCFQGLARVLKPGGQLALADYMLEPSAPKLGASLVRMIVESEDLHGEEAYRSYMAAAGFREVTFTDRFRNTVLGSNRAFMSEQYKGKITAYAHMYFGVWFSVALPLVLRLWGSMFQRGYARHAFIHSRKPPA